MGAPTVVVILYLVALLSVQYCCHVGHQHSLRHFESDSESSHRKGPAGAHCQLECHWPQSFFKVSVYVSVLTCEPKAHADSECLTPNDDCTPFPSPTFISVLPSCRAVISVSISVTLSLASNRIFVYFGH
jgi:hypothetical protein